jgi:TPR repeat protein
MKTLLIAVFALFFTVATAPAQANDFARGQAAYKEGAYEMAMAYWRPLARQGRAAAQYNVGRMYFYGQGVEKNLVEAYKWFTLAARKGSSKARVALPILSRQMTPAQLREAKFNATITSSALRF